MSDYFLRKTVISKSFGKEKIIKDNPFLSFSDNDYLGLSHHEKVKEAMIKAVNTYGCASAPLYLTGYTESHQQFEQSLSLFLGTERTLLFSSAYHANLAVITTLADKHSMIIHDKLNHRSLLDGTTLSGAQLIRVEHNNLSSLEKTLQKYACKNKQQKIIIICDGVFSMDGDIALLPDIIALKKQYNTALIVDDAHGFAHLGNGKGVLEHYGINPGDIDLITATLSKGLGLSGGFISGKSSWIERIEQKAAPYIFSCSLMPIFPAAGLIALEIIQSEKWRFSKIQELTDYLKIKINQINLPLIQSNTAIQPLLLKFSKRTYDYSVYLYRNGIFIAPICYPVVPEGLGRLRITLTVNHNKEDIDRLVNLLLQAKQEIDHD
jgi:8-amino-7-oxononanoate synthase